MFSSNGADTKHTNISDSVEDNKGEHLDDEEEGSIEALEAEQSGVKRNKLFKKDGKRRRQ